MALLAGLAVGHRDHDPACVAVGGIEGSSQHAQAVFAVGARTRGGVGGRGCLAPALGVACRTDDVDGGPGGHRRGEGDTRRGAVAHGLDDIYLG